MTKANRDLKKPDLKVLPGGLQTPLNEVSKDFVSAYVTDTRLMGVLGIYARWSISEGADLHQFFYIDCEESGLETYSSVRGEFSEAARLTEQALIGGLGSKKIPIDEKSLRWLLQHWEKFNAKHAAPLPDGKPEYDFLLDGESHLTIDEQNELTSKICVEISSDYQAVNYFLMRCFGQDYEGAGYLTVKETESGMPLNDDFPLDLYDAYSKATFCKNVIDTEKEYRDGSTSYLCESLIEMNGKHETIISKVVVRNLKIAGFEYCDSFPVTSIEAALMLKKPEYINVFEVLLDDEELEDNIGEFILNSNTVMTTHECGRLFMAFKSTNNHVAERVFMLSNDVRGVYFITDFGQLIAMANTPEDIYKLENVLSGGPLSPYLVPTGKYEFLEPVLLEFVESGFDDFEEFLKMFDE